MLVSKVVFGLRLYIDKHFSQEHLGFGSRFGLFEQCFGAFETFDVTLLGFRSSV